MDFFNDKLSEALFTGEYICPDCGGRMEFEDEKWRDTLVCPACGNSMDLDHYGFTDEEYEDLYPTEDEVVDRYDEEESETYEEVYGDSGD